MSSRIFALVIMVLASVSTAKPDTTIPYYDPAAVCPAEASSKAKDYDSKDDAFDLCVKDIHLTYGLIKRKWKDLSDGTRQHCVDSAKSIASYHGGFSPWDFYNGLWDCVEMNTK